MKRVDVSVGGANKFRTFSDGVFFGFCTKTLYAICNGSGVETVLASRKIDICVDSCVYTYISVRHINSDLELILLNSKSAKCLKRNLCMVSLYVPTALTVCYVADVFRHRTSSLRVLVQFLCLLTK